MQHFITAFVLVVGATTVMAGTRTANPGEEERAISLWNRLCSNGRDGGIEGGVYIHCKHPRQPENINLRAAVISRNNGGQDRTQYIFVQPPELIFNHDVDVRGNGGTDTKTVVYVQPAKTSHKYRATLRTDEIPHSKPELVFLSNNRGNNGAVAAISQPFGDVVGDANIIDLSPVAARQNGNHVVIQ